MKNSILESSKYLEVTYPNKSTDYPNLLAKWISQNVFKKTGNLHDVGCGKGEYLKAFKELGYEVYGVDLSRRIKELKDYSIIELDIESQWLGFIEGTDFIFCKSLLEHTREPDYVISNFFIGLKKGGKLCLMTPAWEYCYQNFYNCHTHYTPFTKESLTNILLMHGFKNVKVSYFYQLPIAWKYPSVKHVCKLINFLKIPYNNETKFIRFSREVMLMAVAEKE